LQTLILLTQKLPQGCLDKDVNQNQRCQLQVYSVIVTMGLSWLVFEIRPWDGQQTDWRRPAMQYLALKVGQQWADRHTVDS